MTDQLLLDQIYQDELWAPVLNRYRRITAEPGLAELFDRPEGIHGVRHAWRVLFHVLVLSRLCQVEEGDRRLLIAAALYHDIGRDNDGLCLVHGSRSAEKMKLLGLFPPDAADAAILEFLVVYHCIADAQALAALETVAAHLRRRTWRMFTIIKDADGLDRVRINALDPKYLRNPEALRLETLAWELLAAV